MNLALLSFLGLSFAVAAAAPSGSTADSSAAKPSCCAKAADGAMKCEKPEGRKMKCSLTGKVVDTCCCVEREGKTHCTLADKDVAECCCSPVEDEKADSAKSN